MFSAYWIHASLVLAALAGVPASAGVRHDGTDGAVRCSLASVMGARPPSSRSGALAPSQRPRPPILRGAFCSAECGALVDQPPLTSNGFFADVSCDVCGGQQTVADDFLVAGDVELCELNVYGGYFPGNVPVADVFHVVIHDDAGGIPGTALYSEANVLSTRFRTGKSLFGVDEWVYTLTLGSPVLLTAGTYWLEVYNDTGFGTDDWFWERGALGNGVLFSAFAYETPGAQWTPFDQELAMKLCGRSLGGFPAAYCDEAQNPNNVADIAIDGTALSPGRSVELSGGPPDQFACLLIGSGDGVSSAPPGAVGDLCVAGGYLGRYARDMGPIDGAGYFGTDISSSLSGGPNFGIPTCGGHIQPGETWYFQYWHRRPQGQPSTFSSAISVTFQQ